MLPDGPGKAIVVKACTSCHTIGNIVKKRGSEDEWADTVSKMIGRGAILTDDDADTLVEYLATHYGPSAPKPVADKSAKPGPVIR